MAWWFLIRHADEEQRRRLEAKLIQPIPGMRRSGRAAQQEFEMSLEAMAAFRTMGAG